MHACSCFSVSISTNLPNTSPLSLPPWTDYCQKKHHPCVSHLLFLPESCCNIHLCYCDQCPCEYSSSFSIHCKIIMQRNVKNKKVVGIGLLSKCVVKPQGTVMLQRSLNLRDMGPLGEIISYVTHDLFKERTKDCFNYLEIYFPTHSNIT